MPRHYVQIIPFHKNVAFLNVPFSSCWRIFVKLKYNLASTKQFVAKFMHLSTVVCVTIFILFLLVFMNEDYTNTHNRLPMDMINHKSNQDMVERLPQVYQVIESWMQQESRNSIYFPRLFMGNKKRLRYTRNELFLWKELPLDNINDILDNLDKKEHDGNISSYGNFGKAVNLPHDLIKESKAKMSLHQLNVVSSDIMSLNRQLSDMRNLRCLKKRYNSHLPSASIIIIFHNEARSTLLRTIHSVVNRSPLELLAEIILVDDASSKEELSSGLDKYFHDFPIPVQILRLEKREGLIRARIRGAEKAIGQILIFLDAHMEATPGWLVPILSEISQDRTRVILPVIDDINAKTFEYSRVENDRMRSGLNWKLRHIWLEPDKRGGVLSGENNDNIEPFPSPTMIGCAFGIDREFFFKSGTYDKEMLIWGGENVEMSIRIWRCGGSLMVVPCSHIGHVYRNVTPHSIPGSVQEKLNRVTINTARFAEVWLDDYKHFYYDINPDAQNVDIGDTSDRKSIIEALQCRSFQWFIDNVYPDAPFPNHHRYFGQIQHLGSNLCVESPGEYGGLTGMKVCHGLGAMQKILYTKDMELRNGVNCMEALMNNKTKRIGAVFLSCNFKDEQKWDFKLEENGSNNVGIIINRRSGKCLTFKAEQNSSDISKKKEKMLAFLAKVVKETMEKVEAPYISDCEKIRNSTVSNQWKETQLWHMKITTGSNFDKSIK